MRRRRWKSSLLGALLGSLLTGGLMLGPATPPAAAAEMYGTRGDIDGDGAADLLFTDSGGNLRFYSSNPVLGAPTKRGSDAANAPHLEPGGDWSTVLYSHNTATGFSTDALFTVSDGFMNYIRPKADIDWQAGDEYYGPSNRAVVIRTRMQDCVGDCSTYFAQDWSRVRQLAAVGDATGDGSVDVVTIEVDETGQGSLWLFRQRIGAALSVQLLSASGWENKTLAKPDDVTGDGVPDLWVRDKTTGELTQYPLLRSSEGLVSLGAPVVIGQGFTEAAYPEVHSDGNIVGGRSDNAADLWTRAPDGTIRTHVGHRTPTGYQFDPPKVLGRDFDIEAEALVPVGGRPPFHQATCCGTTWSDGKFAYLYANQAGASGTLTIAVEREGDYTIDTILTAAPDYGIVRITLDGRPIGQPFDGYNAGGVTNKRTSQGTQHLTAGEHTFGYTITGRNPASTGWAAGVDRILMTRTDAGVNLLSDPGFEAQTTRTLTSPWSASGSAGADINWPGYAHSGSDNGWAYGSVGWNKLTQIVAVEPGRAYRLTGWIETGTTTEHGYFGVNRTDGSVLAEVRLPAGVSDYRQVEVTFTAPASGLVEMFAGTWNTGADAWVRVDDVTLVPRSVT